MVNIEYLKETKFLWDEPVEYSLQCGVKINIYPIKVKDHYIYEYVSEILQIDKNKTSDVRIIKMTYLEYILSCVLSESIEPYKLINLIRLCLHEKDISIEQNKGKLVLGIIDENQKLKAYITSKEFDEIKKIILNQNQYDYKDIKLSDDLQNMVREYYRLTNKGMVKVTLEDKVAFMCNECNINKQEIKEMTNREFSIRFDLAIDKIEYEINKPLETSGQVKFKKGIEHFIFKKEHDMIADMLVNSDSIENKVGKVEK